MNLEISTDKSRLNLNLIHGFITNSYWAKGRTKEAVQKSIDNSISYGVYLNNEQIGFARVLTDYVVFAYIMDVFILEEHRGNGYSKKLMKELLAHPNLQKVEKWFLGTKDAQGLYEQFGFIEVPKGVSWMIKKGISQ